jgi:hypothetical protein
MGRKKMTDAARIRAYFTKNPDAKPRDAAVTLNVSPTNVYVVRNKMKRESEVIAAPTDRAKAWLAVNPWFGKDAKATAIAVGIHQDLLKQGVVADSDEYFKLLDERIRVAAKVALAEKLGVTEITADPVNHPPHYKTGGIETIDFIESKELNYRLGNVIKYITRADHKGNRAEDLKKALWYLQREIEKA